MLEIYIPDFGSVKLEYLVSDFTGTLSVDGTLLPKVREKLNEIAQFLKIHILTADIFEKACTELEGINCKIHIIKGENLDIQKEDYVKNLGAERVVALGNGINDRRMLKTARLGIAVTEGEGCAVDALIAADVHVRSAKEGLDLLLNPKRFKATLRL
ncbi:soluble P-type ATPase [Candidatus Methanoperedens nitroreducens]|uniref:Soluble P-type ATPase n=1 Tax=Candidatus Methanoperedens nitratireducens TaxID=1392998 RepID=A0A062V6F2_9EURY|nr:HAD hydrolase family protein [Candidatus Methanoperedens nitroreducens]KCZ70935.1 soluble P-type ATPase [Candidatus Methanoperedens nitroreducens]MDJ1421698.1 HAD family hydrolase [Candidatus Methanoperedens sp.]